MRTLIFIFLFLGFGNYIIGQTKSDSLYFTKLYPLKNNQLLLIGSETPGSFRKCVLRHYDENLQIKQQRYERSMRNSDVFLDEEFGDQLRVISRYRWNKGKVFLYGDKLEISTVRFFKRDDYKDWKNTEDEPYDYPVERDEKLFGLNPILYDENNCYYFSSVTKEVYIYEADLSYIKPRFQKKYSFPISNGGEIFTYKWLKTDEGIFFYYNLVGKDNSRHFILNVNNNGKSVEFSSSTKYSIQVSDLSLKNGFLSVGGSYVASDQKLNEGFVKYTGNFIQVFDFDTEKNECKLVSENYNEYENLNKDAIVGSRLVQHSDDLDHIYFLFENLNIEKKEVKIKDVMELKGSYHVYWTQTVSVVTYDKKTKQFKIKNLRLKYKGSNENGIIGNYWRTFHELKGQKQQHLLFNGDKIYNYNDPFVEHIDFDSGLLIYGDRNYNYYQINFSKENIFPDLFDQNQNRRKCYFYENFYVRYFKTDWGFKLEKFNY